MIRRVLDKANDREVLPPGGAANLLQLHPDHPVKWDAWDLDRSYRAKVTDLTHGEVTVDGDTVVVTHSFGESSATQRIRLVDDRVEIETEVDWHEREKVLKAAFDVDVHTDHAAYETQFGHVVRPTHENTTWDAARFEVCAHRWVHVGDGGYGVGLANDATYGHDVTRHPRDGGGTFSRVRLSLLRAPLFPDPETDQGRHVLRYALVPGAGIAGAAEAGYALNLPLRRRTGSPVEPLVSVEGTAYVEAVKLAEDGSGDVVVRLYEPLGARTSVRVTRRRSSTAVPPRWTCSSARTTPAPGTTAGSTCGRSRSSPCASVALTPSNRPLSGLPDRSSGTQVRTTVGYSPPTHSPGLRQLLDQPVGRRVVAGREVGEDGVAVVRHGPVLDGPPGRRWTSGSRSGSGRRRYAGRLTEPGLTTWTPPRTRESGWCVWPTSTRSASADGEGGHEVGVTGVRVEPRAVVAAGRCVHHQHAVPGPRLHREPSQPGQVVRRQGGAGPVERRDHHRVGW